MIATTSTIPAPLTAAPDVASPTTETFPAETAQHELHVTALQLREVAIGSLRDVLSLIRLAKWKTEHLAGQDFNSRGTEPFIPAHLYGDNLLTTLNRVVHETFDAPEHLELRILGLNTIAHVLSVQTIPLIVRGLEEISALSERGLQALGAGHLASFSASPSFASSPIESPGYGPESSKIAVARDLLDLQRVVERLEEQQRSGVVKGKKKASDAYFGFRVETQPEILIVHWPGSLGQEFLRATMHVAQALRTEGRDPSFIDFVAFQLASQLLGRCQAPLDGLKAKSWAIPGFRHDLQTYINITDPGDGHVFSTTRKGRWLRGAVLHVEHTDYDNPAPAFEHVDYSNPLPDTSLHDMARTRLHTGSEAPISYFAGRASKDSVAEVATAATSAFRLGAAECRVAMDGLNTGEMVEFMRDLNTATLRNHRQQFTAVFCLNYPIVDDLAPDANGCPRFRTNLMDIARRELDLVIEGGFDAVSWGATSDSECVVHQLRFRNVLELVHAAHEKGLRVAMCTGWKKQDVADAVYAGLDVIRHISGMVSPVMQERLEAITVARDDATASVRGRGAALLARLDSMYFEGSLTLAERQLRVKLLSALARGNDVEIHHLLVEEQAALDVLALPTGEETPGLARAARLLRDESPALREGSNPSETEGQYSWDGFIAALKHIVNEGNECGAQAYYKAKPWSSFMEQRRQKLRNAQD